MYQISLRFGFVKRVYPVQQLLLACMGGKSPQGMDGGIDGHIFTREGTLIASVAQEGMIRRRRPRPD